MKADYVAIIEAAYRLDLDEEGWVQAVARAALASLDAGKGVIAYTFDASDPAAFRAGAWGAAGPAADVDWSPVFPRVPELGAERVRQLYLPAPPALLLSECLGSAALAPQTAPPAIFEHLLGNGIVDCIGVRGVNPNGKGCLLCVPLAQPRRLAPRTRRVLGQIAAHLAAGWRLRDRTGHLGSDEADAVLDPRGKVAHVPSGTPRDQVTTLRAAAQRILRSKRLRVSDPRRSVALWEALVDGQWSLVDHFERDGRKYLLVKRNDPHVGEPRALTLRERQVVAYARLGHSNKLIAYELGLAPSTVSQQLQSALAKLGISSRTALVRLLGGKPGAEVGETDVEVG